MLDLPPPPPAYYYDTMSGRDKLFECIADRITDYYMVVYEPLTDSPQYFDKTWAIYLCKKMDALKEWGAALVCAYDGFIEGSMRHMDAAIELDLEALFMELERERISHE